MNHTHDKGRLCYLRTQRRTWGFSQRELAELMGTVKSQMISRIENGKRDPTMEVALACQVIFGISPSNMFPDAYALVEEEVMRNMYRTDQALEHTTNPVGLRKRELFAISLHRATKPFKRTRKV